MNESYLQDVVVRLQNDLLSSEYGLDHESYQSLGELVEIVLGQEALEAMRNTVDATDGYYYYPAGNVIPDSVDPGHYHSGGADLATMDDLLNALDNRIEEAEDDEPEVELYDDLAD